MVVFIVFLQCIFSVKGISDAALEYGLKKGNNHAVYILE